MQFRYFQEKHGADEIDEGRQVVAREIHQDEVTHTEGDHTEKLDGNESTERLGNVVFDDTGLTPGDDLSNHVERVHGQKRRDQHERICLRFFRQIHCHCQEPKADGVDDGDDRKVRFFHSVSSIPPFRQMPFVK